MNLDNANLLYILLAVITILGGIAISAFVLVLLKDDDNTGSNTSLKSKIVADARVTQTGAVLEQNGFKSVSRTSVGEYVYVLSESQPNSNYTVLSQLYEINKKTDINIFVTGQTNDQFSVTIGQGDNGTGEDTLIDIEHAVVVFASPTTDSQKFVPTNAESVPNRSVFLDESDDVLKYISNDGTVHPLY